MGYFLDSNGSYYEGDKASPDDQEVVKRPSFVDTWSGTAWSASIDKQKKYIQSQIDALEDLCKMVRPIREMMIAIAVERAAGQGYTLEQLRAANKGFKAIHDIELQIQALRIGLS